MPTPPLPDQTLYILYEPITAEAWGWGHSPQTAASAARQRMVELDEAVTPCDDDEPIETYLRRCATLRVRVAPSCAPDLLRLLEL